MFGNARIPSLDGATEWINSEPLTPADLHGHVVLFDFWTYTCINWLRTLPYIRGWSRKYKDDGLIVIGVHTPEFEFEHDLENVRHQVMAMDVDYPVAVDNDYKVWDAFANRYWPALYIADKEGVIRDHHFGEGRYEESERVIQELLGVERELLSVEGTDLEAPADWNDLGSPETYLGYERGDGRTDIAPSELRRNQWTLSGDWSVRPQGVALNEPGGGIAYRFHARDLHLVLGPHNGTGSVRFRVLVDGEAPGGSRGSDVDDQGNGLVSEQRLYQLIRQHGHIDDRTFEITFLDPGVEAYVFTFG
jgi:thiol-disulfide isomerase/thioredoxin